MGKLRAIGEALRVIETPAQAQAREAAAANAAWVARLRAANPSSAASEKTKAAFLAKAQATRDANHADLAKTTWASLHAAGKFKDEREEKDQNSKERGDHPSRIVAVYWPSGQRPYRTLEKV